MSGFYPGNKKEKGPSLEQIEAADNPLVAKLLLDEKITAPEPIRTFGGDLNASNSLDTLNRVWLPLYRTIFPIGGKVKRILGKSSGKDRILELNDGSTVLFEEKIRYEDYGDMLIEVCSNPMYDSEGWATKKIEADFILYAVLPKGVCYKIPVPAFSEAVRNNWEVWREKHGLLPARESGSLNIPVSFHELARAMGLEKLESVEFKACSKQEIAQLKISK